MTERIKLKEEGFKREEKEIKTYNLWTSTGSTLLDKAISGGVRREGGIPGGIIVEVFGESGLGKTAVVTNMAGIVQRAGGTVHFNDPEGRLNREYSKIFAGLTIPEEFYSKDKYVTSSFHEIANWEPERKDVINLRIEDSLAAMTTKLEMENEDGDKMGMRRAKDFSAGMRKIAVACSEDHKLILCTNQVRQGDSGLVTPGGKGVPFYASVRIQLIPYRFFGQANKDEITQSQKFGAKNKEVTKVIGINTMCRIVKNSVDDPLRTAPFCMIFGYGIDDVRANLQWRKDMKGETTYDCLDGKTYMAMNKAIEYIEGNNLEEKLKDATIDLWDEIEAGFEKIERKKKF